MNLQQESATFSLSRAETKPSKVPAGRRKFPKSNWRSKLSAFVAYIFEMIKTKNRSSFGPSVRVLDLNEDLKSSLAVQNSTYSALCLEVANQ